MPFARTQPLTGLLAACLLAGLSGLATAQNAELAEHEALVRQALSQHPAPRGLQAALQAAQARQATAGAWPDPQFSWSVAPKTLHNGLIGERHSYTLAQRLPWPGKRSRQREAQSHEVSAQKAELAALQLQLGDQVRQAYAQWNYLAAALSANRQNRELLDQLAQVARASYAAAGRSRQALIEIELRRGELRQNALRLEQQREGLKAHLNALLNQPADAAIALQGSAPPLTEIPERDVFIHAAMTDNYEIKIIQARGAASESRAQRARLGFFPDLEIRASYLGAMDPEAKRWQVGLALELPLNLTRRRAELDAARADAQSWHWKNEDRRSQLAAGVIAAHAGAMQADQSAALYASELLPLAMDSLRAARSLWQSGQGDFQTLIGAEQALLRLRLEHAGALRDGWIHRSVLDRLCGGKLTRQLFPQANS